MMHKDPGTVSLPWRRIPPSRTGRDRIHQHRTSPCQNHPGRLALGVARLSGLCLRGMQRLLDSAGQLPCSERGSGTIMGVALTLVTLVVLSAVGLGGSIVVTRSHARSIGDVAAVSAARSLQIPASTRAGGSPVGGGGACLMASRVASANGIGMESCSQRGHDVIVEVLAVTSVPFIPTVSSTSVAGPGECG